MAVANIAGNITALNFTESTNVGRTGATYQTNGHVTLSQGAGTGNF